MVLHFQINPLRDQPFFELPDMFKQDVEPTDSLKTSSKLTRGNTSGKKLACLYCKGKEGIFGDFIQIAMGP